MSVDDFPFNLPIIQHLETLDFPSSVTFFVGENGSGKSTILEAIACAAKLPTVGSMAVYEDPTLKAICQLSQQLKWAWNKKTHRGFFMRSEDFFGFVKRIDRMKAEFLRELEQIDIEYEDRPLKAKQLAKSPIYRELRALEDAYDKGLDVQSHGESYFKLFQSRFVPNGLYLLDEPEAPLSPSRQLAFMSMLHEMLQQDAQFIIATHSPILLAFPDATIYSFDNGRIQPTEFDDLEHVRLTRDFLTNPQLFLRHLLGEET